LADAKFFYDQDRKKTLASRVEGLAKVVYHNKLGTQGERTDRVRAIAKGIAALLPQAKENSFVQAVDTAAQLAKTDLLTDMAMCACKGVITPPKCSKSTCPLCKTSKASV
jgi:glycyl-tRNA synthetase beta chain